ncbi:MAG: prolyl oligopeptidase family serine peptidase [Bacteroidetes bacterium]|nr:prolyl oligopeptidase family serine peptidase [Bacteroidota bacterium]MBS1756774.1 prolyl oligopeptidase family serine peptidase [Bacteroidota bacterium]
MTKKILFVVLAFITGSLYAQDLGKLTVEKIMRDPKWMGTSPSGAFWSVDGSKLYFYWNPDKAPSDSLYFITLKNKVPVKATVEEKREVLEADNIVYNKTFTAYVYNKDGDIFYVNKKNGKTIRITQTFDFEYNPGFCFNDSKIVYTLNQNLFAWDIATGQTSQLTNVKSDGNAAAAPNPMMGFRNRSNSNATQSNGNIEEEWLNKDQLKNFEVLKSRKEKRDAAMAYEKATKQKEMKAIVTGDKRLQGINISPDGRFVSYRLVKYGVGKNTIVPDYVTESGYTTDLNGRTKVGGPQSVSEFYLYDRDKDSIIALNTNDIPGIKDIPAYVKDYPNELKQWQKKDANRAVDYSGMSWSPNGQYGVVEVSAQDNKDRWLMLWDASKGSFKLLDRQHDDAWIQGPGIDFRSTGWIDDNNFWYQSEATGYSHLYIANVTTGSKKQLTNGNYEVQEAQLSRDKKTFYIITNQVAPGEKQFYQLNIASGKTERITNMTGANRVTVSPDEKHLAVIYSYTNKPWELYLQDNKPHATPVQLTFKAQSDEFKSYAWRDPELITFKASDGADVYARVYKPANPDPAKPGVLFVHGAGYLQNAHKWWSDYFREFMFNNLLADNGYYVMDIDYRGSAGYGRNWRTGIYRHMGGKDLTDNVDAINYMVKNFGVNPKHTGVYGGSYGGFISLMAMFTQPDVFTSGAALRPVTDWANYNHGYTSNILNEPFTDSIAYYQSSPLYFANGLKGNLLICHGMVDLNVNFQDAVKLSQRLIELGKDNWEIAPFPMEDHGFVEPSSWTDEYKRIFKLFENTLKK